MPDRQLGIRAGTQGARYLRPPEGTTTGHAAHSKEHAAISSLEAGKLQQQMARLFAVSKGDELLKAVRRGHAAGVQMLLATGALTSAREGGTNNTPLHIAAEQGHAAIVSMLCKAGAPLEEPNADGATPLHVAVTRSHAAVAQALLAAGASVAAVDEEGRTPLHSAAALGDLRMVDTLLGAGASLNEPDSTGWTPLHSAAGQGHQGVVSALLAAGASTAAVSRGGKTPEDVASMARHHEVSQLLRQHTRDASALQGADAVHQGLAEQTFLESPDEVLDTIAALTRENHNLEEQASQACLALAHTHQEKVKLHEEMNRVQQELAEAALLLEQLGGKNLALKAQLHEACAVHAELSAAGQRLAAAESAIQAGNLGCCEDELRRAVSQKAAALGLLASASKLFHAQYDFEEEAGPAVFGDAPAALSTPGSTGNGFPPPVAPMFDPGSSSSDILLPSAAPSYDHSYDQGSRLSPGSRQRAFANRLVVAGGADATQAGNSASLHNDVSRQSSEAYTASGLEVADSAVGLGPAVYQPRLPVAVAGQYPDLSSSMVMLPHVSTPDQRLESTQRAAVRASIDGMERRRMSQERGKYLPQRQHQAVVQQSQHQGAVSQQVQGQSVELHQARQAQQVDHPPLQLSVLSHRPRRLSLEQHLQRLHSAPQRAEEQQEAAPVGWAAPKPVWVGSDFFVSQATPRRRTIDGGAQASLRSVSLDVPRMAQPLVSAPASSQQAGRYSLALEPGSGQAGHSAADFRSSSFYKPTPGVGGNGLLLRIDEAGERDSGPHDSAYEGSFNRGAADQSQLRKSPSQVPEQQQQQRRRRWSIGGRPQQLRRWRWSLGGKQQQQQQQQDPQQQQQQQRHMSLEQQPRVEASDYISNLDLPAYQDPPHAPAVGIMEKAACNQRNWLGRPLSPGQTPQQQPQEQQQVLHQRLVQQQQQQHRRWSVGGPYQQQRRWRFSLGGKQEEEQQQRWSPEQQPISEYISNLDLPAYQDPLYPPANGVAGEAAGKRRGWLGRAWARVKS
ncbi:hypothetical protein N2152v2_005152 [Parachlorella kessleri]